VRPAKKDVHVSFTTIDTGFEQADGTELAEKQSGQRHNAEMGKRAYEGRRLENVLAVGWITAGVILSGEGDMGELLRQ
jgi:hypothetical protein